MKCIIPAVFLGILVSSAAWAAAPAGHFGILAAQGIVKDNKSGLTWERGHSNVVKTWGEAGTYCATLSLGGFSSGWRLPTAFEVETLVDVRTTEPAIDTGAFPDTPIDLPFWTSTVDAADPTTGRWVLYFSGGALQNNGDTTAWVRCVR